jgi:hypothetical protein
MIFVLRLTLSVRKPASFAMLPEIFVMMLIMEFHVPTLRIIMITALTELTQARIVLKEGSPTQVEAAAEAEAGSALEAAEIMAVLMSEVSCKRALRF